MENAPEALKMVAAVLIFVLALSISINAFGEARRTARVIIDNQDREFDTSYSSGNGQTERVIGGETLVPSIYRAYKENYKIIFKFKDNNNNYLYEKKDDSSTTSKNIKVYAIDLEKEVIGNDQEKEDFIQTFLYGQNYKKFKNKSEFDQFKAKLEKEKKIILQNESFYDIIKKKTFEEQLGVYYQDEVQGESETPNANKTKKRIITYVEI